MGKSLFEFAGEKREGPKAETSAQTSQEDLKKTFDKYSKLSEGELMGELFSQVGKQKRNGTFNFSELAEKIEAIRPMLSDEQIKNLDKLLDQIR